MSRKSFTVQLSSKRLKVVAPCLTTTFLFWCLCCTFSENLDHGTIGQPDDKSFGSKPNIVFVLADDLGWGNVGFHRDDASENKEIETPTLDRLATVEGRILNRHYVHAMCTPTRTSLYTGRLPVHVFATNEGPCNPHSGIPENMTTIATKMAKAGYATHFIGKWDAGMATSQHIPKGRGFQTSLNYFSHGNWMHSYATWEGSYHNRTTIPTCLPENNCFKDLWDTDHPAIRLASSGAYEEELFRMRFNQLLDHHSHIPIESNRRAYASMVSYLDDQVANLTGELKQRKMWENTLFIFSTDNGGYVKSALSECITDDKHEGATVCLNGEAGASNHPLRGGKYSYFEGGVRGTAFVSGGVIPPGLRNVPVDGIIHIADWYATFSHLAGLESGDEKIWKNVQNGHPGIDSINVWDLLTDETGSLSPRDEVFLGSNALIRNNFKLLLGMQRGAGWCGPVFPNSTFGPDLIRIRLNCSHGCLFDVQNDPTEHNDIAKRFPNVTESMKKRLHVLRKTIWSLPKVRNDPACKTVANRKWNGFLGPYLNRTRVLIPNDYSQME